MKKLIAFLLCSVLVLGSLSFAAAAADTEDGTEAADSDTIEIIAEKSDITPAEVGAEAGLADTGYSIPSETEFSSKLNSLRSKYPDGSVWEGVYYEYGVAKAWTCFAYAVQMQYEIFGVRYIADRIYEYIDYDRSGIIDSSGNGIHAGDIVRINGDSHSIFITEVTSDGYYFTDGNGTGIYNQIRWDGYYSRETMYSIFTYKVNLPGNSLRGTDIITHTIAYDGNGGSGSMEAEDVPSNYSFTLKENGFVNDGYTFEGYTVKRGYDNKWYTEDNGWQTLSNIYDNNYTFKIYPSGRTLTFDDEWIGGAAGSASFTFFAEWLPVYSNVEFMDNYSCYNYLLGSDFGSGWDDLIYPRSSIYSLSVDYTERFNNQSSLKVEGKAAGSSGRDLVFTTSTNTGYGIGYSQAGICGDEKDLTMRISIKSPTEGAKFCIRWGYQSSYASISLRKGWGTYNISLPKNRFFGSSLHPYFDKAGTYYINSVSLADGSWNTGIAPESGGWYTSRPVRRGEAVGSLPVPQREGYYFTGWYTAAEGGEPVTADTVINESALRLYAHWSKDISFDPVKSVEYDGHMYALYDNVLGWEEANVFCMLMGGHLVTIDSEMENRMVYSLISDRIGYCWTGMHYNSSDRKWEWMTGDSLSYRNWYSDKYEYEDTGEYYGMIYPMNVGTTAYAGKWDKVTGSSYYRSFYGYYNSFFVCEYDRPEYIGDVDGDGEVGSADVTVIQRHQCGMDTGYSSYELYLGDVDENGELEIIDATFIQRWLANIPIPYEIGKWVY